jgi:hypothetical protein
MTPAWPRALYIYRQCMFITVIITVWVPVQCNWRVYVKFVGTLPFPIIDCQNRKGILMLHCGLGMRNMNTFYTFRCPVERKYPILHLTLILMLHKHWHHCFLTEFSKDDLDFFKEASSYNHLSPHKVMSRSNLHFLYKYNLIISNDCGHLNV